MIEANYREFIEGYYGRCRQKYFDMEHPGRCNGRGVLEWQKEDLNEEV